MYLFAIYLLNFAAKIRRIEGIEKFRKLEIVNTSKITPKKENELKTEIKAYTSQKL
jgi:hypothetical protein